MIATYSNCRYDGANQEGQSVQDTGIAFELMPPRCLIFDDFPSSFAMLLEVCALRMRWRFLNAPKWRSSRRRSPN